MKDDFLKEQLIIPIYLNEKTVLDMLAIIEDGFSMISEVNSSSQSSNTSNTMLSGGISTRAILDKLLKIQINGRFEKGKNSSEETQTKLEKVHTNVSLFSKFRSELIKNQLLSCTSSEKLDISKIESGDFIEIEGELQKNPLIDLLEKFINVINLSDIFSEEQKTLPKEENANNALVQQMNLFLQELTHSGTIDFIIKNTEGTLVLSAQKQYLSNDNISEIIGGKFKILGKVIKVCKTPKENINLLRKTSLYLFDKNSLDAFASIFNSDEFKQFNLPDVQFEIPGPSAIIIPIAIYA
ncbi:DUF6414 family protein [Clostridium fessum]|uniref:DUF6414 family protein n=1 Tax=Clostridium fessum TaxID=2126740 RepID=UPI0022E3C06A|nr:hypothetical protein [Clostridium fessum]